MNDINILATGTSISNLLNKLSLDEFNPKFQDSISLYYDKHNQFTFWNHKPNTQVHFKYDILLLLIDEDDPVDFTHNMLLKMYAEKQTPICLFHRGNPNIGELLQIKFLKDVLICCLKFNNNKEFVAQWKIVFEWMSAVYVRTPCLNQE
ncbi:hypothetical protein OAB94_02130 [Flavobacteriaceae bacterium]|nr:hypothetical protein [Flavobacteriaceae bacterium]